MRTFKVVMLLVMTMSLVTTTSCSNDDDNSGNGGQAPSGVLIAKVDGASYESVEVASSATIANNGDNLIIIAANSDGNSFSISIFGFDGEGTYDITGADPLITNVASYQETDVSDPMNPSIEIWQAPYDDTMVGSITITELTETTIKGTFDFTCKNANDDSVKTISEGAFNLDVQTI